MPDDPETPSSPFPDPPPEGDGPESSFNADPEGPPIDPPERVDKGGGDIGVGGASGPIGVTPSSDGVGAGGAPIGTGGAPIGTGGAPIGPGGAPIGRPAGEAGAPPLIGGETAIFRGGRPIGGLASLFNIGGAPVNAGSTFVPGVSFEVPGSVGGTPVGGSASIFNIGGAPIAVLGGVFNGGLPIGGPVTQVFRGGSGPQPNTLFLATISPSGPIGNFFIGLSGSPIGVAALQAGGLAIGPSEAVVIAVQEIQGRTALVTELAVAFAGGQAAASVPPIGVGGMGTGGSPIGG